MDITQIYYIGFIRIGLEDCNSESESIGEYTSRIGPTPSFPPDRGVPRRSRCVQIFLFKNTVVYACMVTYIARV